MLEKLLELQKNAYSEYSNFSVAAIIVTKDDKEYKGVNVEDASLRAGACAERVALFNMISDGYSKGDIKEINILADNLITPCFVCRQMFVELCDMDTIVNCYDKESNMKSYKVSELCPYPFDSEDLK